MLPNTFWQGTSHRDWKDTSEWGKTPTSNFVIIYFTFSVFLFTLSEIIKKNAGWKTVSYNIIYQLFKYLENVLNSTWYSTGVPTCLLPVCWCRNSIWDWWLISPIQTNTTNHRYFWSCLDSKKITDLFIFFYLKGILGWRYCLFEGKLEF